MYPSQHSCHKLRILLGIDTHRLKNKLDKVDFNNLKIYIQVALKKQTLKFQIENENKINGLINSNFESLNNTMLLISPLMYLIRVHDYSNSDNSNSDNSNS